MNDIARLSAVLDTSSVDKGIASLKKLTPAAKSAEAATERFNAAAAGVTPAAGGAAGTIKSFSAAASGAAGATDKVSRAALASGSAMKTVQTAAAGASASMGNLVATTARVGTSFVQADAHVQAYTASLQRVPAAAGNARSSLNRLGAAANDNINRLQSTPGNIAAQFQDIGVTAAAGMNPMLIALQQGTQLSSAMAGGFGNVIAGFRQLFSLTTVLTIGLVAVVAAGLQMVDWMMVADTVLNGLADGLDFMANGLETMTPLLIAVGVASLIAFGPAILSSVLALTTAIFHGLVTAVSTATLAMISFSLANPFGAIVIAIVAVIAAMTALNDYFGGAFTSILNMVKSVANGIISFFAKAFNFVKDAFESMLNAMVGPLNSFFSAVGLDISLGSVDFSGATINTDRDFVGDGINFVKDLAGQAADGLRGLAGSLTPDVDLPGGGRSGAGASAGTQQRDPYEDIINNAKKAARDLELQSKALDMTANAARYFTNEQEMLNRAMDAGVKLTEAQRAEIADYARVITDAEIANGFKEIVLGAEAQNEALRQAGDLIGLYGIELEYAKARQDLVNEAVREGAIDFANMTDKMRERLSVIEDLARGQASLAQDNNAFKFLEDVNREFEQQTFLLGRQREELGLTGAALEAYRIETDLLVEAKRKSITLTPAEIAGIQAKARAEADLTEEIARQRNEMEFGRDQFQGFFQDMLSGLRQGQSAWQTFGNAVMRVVDNIIDRLLFSEGGGIDGLLGSLGKLFGGSGPQARLLGSVTNTIDANPELFAKGGTFGSVQEFAKGGSFTNGVYNSPTMFKFANGGSFGVMGEAGPEAVMPLKRGPDGSLGVQMNGPQRVEVMVDVNDERFNAYVDQRSGAQISAAAPQIAQAGSELAQSEMALMQNRAL